MIAIPFLHDSDHKGNQLKNARLHNISNIGDVSPTLGGTLVFMASNDDKRIAFWDDQLSQLVKVPRGDRAETVSTPWNFTVATGTSPFTVVSTTVVTNLNADLLDGLHASAAATGTTIPSRDSGGRMKAEDPVAADDVANKRWVESNPIRLEFTQVAPATTWGPFTHNKGHIPMASVLIGGRQAGVNVALTNTQATVTLETAQAGTLVLH